MASYNSFDDTVQVGVSNQKGSPALGPPQEQVTSPDAIQKQKQESSKPAWRVHAVTVVILVLSLSCTVMLMQFTSQYVYYRVGLKYFNSSTHSKSQSVPCDVNGTTEDRQLQQRVQKEASYLQLSLILAEAAPAVITNVFMGSYSDILGRKMMFFVPEAGFVVKFAVLVAVVYFELELYILYPVYVVTGFCGGLSLVLEAVFVMNADVTPSKEKRTVVLAVVEGFQLLASSLSSLIAGLLILHLGYLHLAITVLAVQTLALIISVAFIRNTAPNSRIKKRLSPLHHIKNFISFYVEGPGRRRLQYRLALIVFFLTLLNVLGRLGTTTLYQLNRPFCWNAAYIGYFGAAQRGLTALVSTTFVATATRCLSLEMIAVLGLVSGFAALVLEGLAVNDVMLYLVTVAGMLANAPVAVCRILMSKWTPPEKQGAMFSGIAVMQGVCFALSNVVFNSIYAATLSIFRGFVFLLIAALCLIAIALLFWLRHISAADYVEDVIANTTDVAEGNGVSGKPRLPTEEKQASPSLQEKAFPSVPKDTPSFP